MFKFLNSKKGFTLVELVIVLVLLGFGAFAIANLFNAGNRSFNKTENRYIRQEEVKNVAEYLQKQASVGGATKVELYSNLGVVPPDGEADNNFNYVFVNPDDGCLYIKPVGKDTATQISNTKLYIAFDVIPYVPSGSSTGDDTKGRGVVCHICAVENEFDYEFDGNGDLEPPSSDDIFYSIDVAYHFANMIETGGLYVNYFEDVDPSTRLLYYRQASTIVNGVEKFTVPENAIVLKYLSDLSLTAEGAVSDVSLKTYCFVATAAYGVNNGDGTVGLLCDFRDSVLMQSAPGRAFVKCYYTVSPPIAKAIAKSEPLKAAVRLALKPLVIVATFALDHDLLAANTAYIIILMITTAAAVTVIVYCKKRSREKSK